MLRNILKIFSLVLVISIFNTYGPSAHLAFAASPGEECQHAEEAGLTCKICGDCAVIYNNAGQKFCKKCGEMQCNIDDCNKCSDPDCANN